MYKNGMLRNKVKNGIVIPNDSVKAQIQNELAIPKPTTKNKPIILYLMSVFNWMLFFKFSNNNNNISIEKGCRKQNCTNNSYEQRIAMNWLDELFV